LLAAVSWRRLPYRRRRQRREHIVMPSGLMAPLHLAAFVTDEADLDHCTPVLYKFVERHPRARVDLVLTDYFRSYEEDFRVRYLESLGVQVHHVVEDLGIGPRLQRAYFELAGSRSRVRRLPASIWRRIRGRGRLFGSAAYAERFLATEPGRSVRVILHNHYGAGVIAFSHVARRAGIASVAVPHSADTFDNRMSKEQMLNYPVRPLFPVAPGDRIIAPSADALGKMLRNQVTTANRVSVLGSARFCAEWQQVLARIVPPASPPVPPGHFRILVLAPKPESNYFEAEVLRIIETVRRLPRVSVAVKLHPRTAVTGRVRADNVRFLGRDTASRALIDWADLTLFSATSTIHDQVMLDRPVLFLRRTLNNRITAERYIQSWAVDSRDELCDQIVRLQSGAQERTYSLEERDRLIRALVEPAGRDVLNLYVDEIERAVALSHE